MTLGHVFITKYEFRIRFLKFIVHITVSATLRIPMLHIDQIMYHTFINYIIILFQEEKAIERGILPLLQRATLVQTFGQRNHVCLKDGSITIPPYAPPQKMHTHLIPDKTPRSIFVYFRGLFYDVGNDPEGGYYAR
jgi:hypothetical protein